MIRLLVAVAVLTSPVAAQSIAPDRPHVILPSLVSKVTPDWPVGVRGATGKRVVVQAVIGVDGVPREVTILSSGDERLNEAAIDAVQKWRYTPATQAGAPVAMYFTINLDTGPHTMEGGIAPRRVTAVDPEYPESLRPEKVKGEVEVELKIGTDGSILATKVIRSDHPAFTDAALRAFAASKYEPATRKGRPVVAYERLVVKFRSKDAAKKPEVSN